MLIKNKIMYKNLLKIIVIKEKWTVTGRDATKPCSLQMIVLFVIIKTYKSKFLWKCQ